MVNIVKHDLEYILKQIKIAERHAAGEDLNTLIAEAGGVDPNSPASSQAHLLPYGLRTVDGSYNNLLPGREEWGAADQQFLPQTDPSFREGSGTFPYSSNNDYGISGDVVDAEPRLISNLIVDQTLDNPAAIVAALEHAGVAGLDQAVALQEIRDAHTILKSLNPGAGPAYATQKAILDGLLDQYGIQMDGPTVFLPNVSPDIGDSASYSSIFTLFGQFFDHGLDLVAKGGNGTVYMPLSPDDPLYNPASPQTNFMVLTRATVGEGAKNSTTPWVDQNQTYGSHASKQVFMREYEIGADGRPVATGLLLEGAGGGLATWADVKAQARDLLGIELTDADVGNIPLIVADEYGNFIPGANGYAQLVVGLGTDGIFGTADDELVEGDPAAPINPTAVGAFRTGHAFIDDIAHNAVPGSYDFDDDGNPLTPSIKVAATADADEEAGNAVAVNNRGQNTEYDDELLDAHYITGDGRGNENIGLTTIHHIFHGEHNRMVEETKRVAIEAAESGDLAFLNEWLLVDVTELPADLSTLVWDGERLFQSGRFVTEMEYQHLVFEEFARKMQPDVDAFLFEPDPNINPAIFAEFANVVYRFGHSMLNETVDRVGADGTAGHVSLFDAFLNPILYDEDGAITHEQAAGAVIRGMSAQVGNEIDEFVTNTLRNQLLGIPLDLPAINIARGRDTGMPTLNEAREQFRAIAGGDSQLDPYTSWTDFALNLKNPASIVNFIAAYGTHDLIAGEASIEGKRAAAMSLVFGTTETFWDPIAGAMKTIAPAADRSDFLNGTGAYADDLGGLNGVDLWMGGLAEKKMDFGGMLGSTFSFIFELQLENLQDGDRFYYLSRVQGLNLLSELESNSLAKMALRTTDLEETGSAIPGDIFSRPDRVLYMDLAKQIAMTGLEDPEHDNPYLEAVSALVDRRDTDGDGVTDYIRYNGVEHVVIQGTDGDDHIFTGEGDDSLWGGDGNDRLEGGYGVDHVHGGAGDDIITNAGTDIGAADFLHGEEGNDVIHGGSGLSLVFGNQGSDFLIAGPDGKTVMGGIGDDFIMGGDGMDFLLGEAGDDWMEGGARFDTLAGENSELMFNSTIMGNDVLNGQYADTDYDAEAGDDIMFQGVGIQRSNGMAGFDWATHKDDPVAANSDLGIPIFANQEAFILRDRFDLVEGLSGWRHNDVLTGRVVPVNTRVEATGTAAIPAPGSPLYQYSNALLEKNVALIDGLDELVAHLQRYEEVGKDGKAETVVMETADASDILLGGGGSDRIKGLAGNDVIDGDKWLNVRILITHGGIRYTADGMTKKVYLESDMVNGVLAAGAAVQFGGLGLDALMLAGTLNPGELKIVREIVDGNAEGDIDTALFTGIREYFGFGVNTDGSLYVNHAPPATDETEVLGDNIEGLTEKPVLDGRDTVRNIERLEFTDLTMNVIEGTEAGETLNGNEAGTGLIHDVLMGFEGDDTLNGLSGDDVLIGDAGNDRLRGGEGNDIYVFGLDDGNDRIDEVSGNDRISYALAGQALSSLNFSRTGSDNLRIELNGQILTVAGQFAGDANAVVETITFDGGNYHGYDLHLADDEGDEVFRGTYALSTGTGADLIAEAGVNTILIDAAGGAATALTGDAGADMLFGNGGADTLNGGAGDDLLVGGTGNDTYIVGDLRDVVVEEENGGRDTIETSLATYILNANVENLTYTGTGDFTAAGNELDNVITGGDANDSLYGEDGADRLIGGLGDDFLNGGAGDDVLNGGAGNDAVNGGAGDDAINVGAGFNTIVYDQENFGNDTVASFDANPNGGGQDRIDLSGLGITDADFASRVSITTAGGDTRIDVAGGSITLTGVSGTGANTIDRSDFILDGETTINGTANGETLDGTSGADIILGHGGDDTINGLAGNDVIDGGAGDDVSNGGSGDDVIHWNAATGGWDVIDGGSEGIAGDTLVITGDDSYEIFRFYPAEDAETVIPGLVLKGGATEIVVTRTTVVNGVEGAPQVIAELSEIEEIVINGTPASGVGDAGGDRFELIGDFAEQGEETSLRLNTVTIIGSEGNDTVDISGLLSAHRVVFKTKGGNDTIVGTLRPQDVVELPGGTTFDDYDAVQNDNGSTTLVGDEYSVTFFSNGGMPQFASHNGEDEDSYTPPVGTEAEGQVDQDDQNGDDDQGHEPDGGHDDNHDDDHDHDDDDSDHDHHDDDDDGEACDTDDDAVNAPAAAMTGTQSADALIGTAEADTIMGLGGRDVIFAGAGDDNVFGGAGADMLYGDAGDDRILGGNGNDFVNAGSGRDTVFGGNGDDLIVAQQGDGDDTYYGDDMVGGSGKDTLDMSAITADIVADLGTGFMGRGSVSSIQSDSDTIWGVENIVTGSGDDTITASGAVNVMDGGTGNNTFRFLSAADADGDTIVGFQPGDKIDLSGMDANGCASGNQAFLVSDAFTGARGELLLSHETRDGEDYTVVEGNVSGGPEADFKISIKGSHDLTASDFNL